MPMTARTIRIAINAEMDIASAILQAGRMSAQLGFGPGDQSRVATVVSELARNIVKYAGTGQVIIGPVERGGRRGIEIVAEDRGPGIENVEQAMSDQYSSGGTLGLGLPGVRRMLDDFLVESAPGQGTRVTGRKWR
jgi:serine/threonine-protein kinase RsbT